MTSITLPAGFSDLEPFIDWALPSADDVNRRPNGTPDRRAKGTPVRVWYDGRGTRLALRAA